MPVLELLSGFVTAPDTTQVALTMASGNSLTIRNAAPDSRISLLQAWADVQGAGILRARSPLLHDNVQGLRFRTVVSEVDPLFPMGSQQRLFPQDQLIVDLSGSATAGDVESACLLVYYADLPGASGRYITAEELMSRLEHVVTIENSLALGTAGGYSGEEALNAEFDLLRADRDYAIIGYHCSAECAAVRWRGVDFGNLGVGGPGNETDKFLTGNWFYHLSRYTGLATIPVFNRANVAGLLVDGVQDENGTDTILTTICGLLTPGG